MASARSKQVVGGERGVDVPIHGLGTGATGCGACPAVAEGCLSTGCRGDQRGEPRLGLAPRRLPVTLASSRYLSPPMRLGLGPGPRLSVELTTGRERRRQSLESCPRLPGRPRRGRGLP